MTDNTDGKDWDISNVATCNGYVKIYLSFYDALAKKRKVPPEIALEMVHNFMANYLAHTQHCVPEQGEPQQIFFMPQEEGGES